MRHLLWQASVLAWPLVDPDALLAAVEEPTGSGQSAFLATHPQCPEPTQAWAHVWSGRSDIVRRIGEEADSLLAPDGARARLRLDKHQPGREILRWRALTLYLPPTILLGLSAIDPAPETVRLLDRTIAPTTPAASLHVHLGAAASFASAWEALCRAHARGRRPPLPSPIPALTDSQWRRLLDAALAWRVDHGVLDDPEAWPLRRLLAPTSGRRDDDRTDRLLSLRRRPPGREREPTAIRRLQGRHARGLLQYLRIQALFFRQLTMDPRHRGLATFTRRYAESTRALWAIDPGARHVDALLAEEREDLPIAAMEVRISPGTRAEVARRALADAKGVERGIVYHFLRAPTRPRADPTTFDLSFAYRAHLRAAARIRRELRIDRSDTDVPLVGLDIAGDERVGPLWLAAPILAALRKDAAQLAARRGRPAALKLTLHAGEDFDTHLAGLRAVAEPVDWGLLGASDRLGHARALGTSPETYAAAHPVGLRAWFDRVVDLGWARQSLIANDPRSAALLSYVDAALERLGVAPPVASRLFDLLGRNWPAELGYPFSLRTHAEDAALLLQDRLSQGSSRNRCLKLVEVEASPELDLVRTLQLLVAARLGAARVGIEICPSSNMIVGGTTQVLEQPLFWLRPVDPNERAVLPVAICTDDPLSFTTSLADEYAYAWAGMVVSGGVPPAWARAWLDEAARASMQARFTTPPLSRTPRRSPS